MHGMRRLVQHGEGFIIFIGARERSANRAEESTPRAKGIVYGRGFISAVHHTVGALGIARLGPVLLPLGFAHQLVEGVSVAVLQQVAGLLPPEQVEGWHAPCRAGIVALAHEEFQKQRRLVEYPPRLAVRQDGAEQPPSARASQEVLLVGRLVVRVAGREHHAFGRDPSSRRRRRARCWGRRRRTAWCWWS